MSVKGKFRFWLLTKQLKDYNIGVTSSGYVHAPVDNPIGRLEHGHLADDAYPRFVAAGYAIHPSLLEKQNVAINVSDTMNAYWRMKDKGKEEKRERSKKLI